ncbi:MAG TPA: hypothetical protein VI542_18325, partial [Candidatus Tectomicrobia bacterium]
ILAANGRRGRDGGRKKLILLTATPINNNIFDLYNQINLFTGNDRTYFASTGIGDLYTYFLAARRESIEEGSIRIFNLLEEVIVHVVPEGNTCQPVPMSPTIPDYARRDPLIARGVGAHPTGGSGLHPGA